MGFVRFFTLFAPFVRLCAAAHQAGAVTSSSITALGK
jgi:hypothetical protein